MTTVAPERAKDGYRLGKDEGEALWPVSYTHLTLPTILRV